MHKTFRILSDAITFMTHMSVINGLNEIYYNLRLKINFASLTKILADSVNLKMLNRYQNVQ